MSDEAPTPATTAGPDDVAVSVIVPVYNAMPYLLALLDSLAAQDLPEGSFEVIAVNDGSTDDGPAALDAFAADRANARVFHQENSGWPGGPRNVGLDAARGRYVFFADADDELGHEALRRMVAFADEHGSDVVVPKIVGVDGRSALWPYGEREVDADLETVVRSLMPCRMFRRSMLAASHIRFPEEPVRLEDGMMVTPAYYAARRVSALGDYDYYFLRKRDDGENISARRLDPVGYTWSIGEVARLTRENDPDPDRAARVVLDLYRRKCLRMYTPRRFARMPDAERDQWMHEHRSFMAEYIPPELESGLEPVFRHRSERLRADDKAGLLTLGRIEREATFARLVRGRWSTRRLRLDLEVELWDPEERRPELFVQVEYRDSGTREEVPLVYRGLADDDADESRVWAGLTRIRKHSASIPSAMLRSRAGGIIDLHVLRARDEGADVRARVAVAESTTLPARRGPFTSYETVNGNLSIEVRPSRAARAVRWCRRHGVLPRRRRRARR